jgi:hypothetical protein
MKSTTINQALDRLYKLSAEGNAHAKSKIPMLKSMQMQYGGRTRINILPPNLIRAFMKCSLKSYQENLNLTNIYNNGNINRQTNNIPTSKMHPGSPRHSTAI